MTSKEFMEKLIDINWDLATALHATYPSNDVEPNDYPVKELRNAVSKGQKLLASMGEKADD